MQPATDRQTDTWHMCTDKEGERKSNELRDEGGSEKGGGGGAALKQRERVKSMAAVAVTFLAEQISWPEEKDKHGRGNHV